MIRTLEQKQMPRVNLVPLCLLGIVVTSVFFDIFALKVTSAFYLSISLPILYFSLFCLLAHKALVIDPLRLFLYLLFGLLALISPALSNTPYLSTTSFALLLVSYFPLLFSPDNRVISDKIRVYVLHTLLNCGLVIAVFGIVQFFLQFLIKSPAVIDIGILFPDWMIDQRVYNTSNPISTFYKSNGFLTREPSILSILLSIVLLLELLYYFRWRRLVIIVFAMFLTFSGSGIMLLLVGMIFSVWNIKHAISFLLFVCLILTLGYVFKDTEVVGYFMEKSVSFAKPGTSAYARFVAPTEAVGIGLRFNDISLLVGNGAGSYPRFVNFAMPREFGIHDPTWAKLLFEYGLLGAVCLLSLIVRLLTTFKTPGILIPILLYAWLCSGGQLLNANFTIILFLLLFLPSTKTKVIMPQFSSSISRQLQNKILPKIIVKNRTL